MTATDPPMYSDAEWAARLKSAVEQTLRKRQTRRDAQADHYRRRAAGLTQRHARRVHRQKSNPTREDRG